MRDVSSRPVYEYAVSESDVLGINDDASTVD